jgi:hypothetical protein
MNVPPEPYDVSYSRMVRESLRALIIRAKGTRAEHPLRLAVTVLEHRLRIYPQFGQPLYDLSVEPAQVWVGVVPPLVVHYLLDEETRQVIVGRPFMLLPNSGIDTPK